MGGNEITVDESCFPVVLLVSPAMVDNAGLAAFFANYERVLARKQPFVTVADATAASERPPATIRKQIADWSRAIEPQMIRYSKGDARIVRSSLIRGAMTAIGWMHKTPVPQEWFSSSEAAFAWAIARLDEANVTIPPAVRARLTLRAAT